MYAAGTEIPPNKGRCITLNRDNVIDAFGYVDDQYLDLADNEKPKEKIIPMYTKKNHRSTRKIMMLAATLALLAAFATVAYAAGSRILMHIRDTDSEADVEFQAADTDFIRLGTWLPDAVPTGYETDFVSDPAYGNQVVIYRNSNDNMIRYEFAKAGTTGDFTVLNVEKKESVTIGGSTGVLYTASESQGLFWTDELEGIGFILYSDDKALDLPAIAQSVKKVDTALVPSNQAGTEEALQSFGDYCLTEIPSGFRESSVTGSPVENGGWYGCVRRVYENETLNKQIYFFYETYQIPDDVQTDDPAAYILSCRGDGEAVEINGMPGITATHDSINCVYWVDAEKGLSFGVNTDAVSVNDLVQIARSVQG